MQHSTDIQAFFGMPELQLYKINMFCLGEIAGLVQAGSSPTWAPQEPGFFQMNVLYKITLLCVMAIKNQLAA